ncbi:MAG TPA: hypothetical protein VIK52_05150 [Opitutaceae bacterium]
MNFPRLTRLTSAAILAVLLAGCAFKAGYDPSYLPASAMKLGIPGKALVVLEVSEEQRVYKDNPRSFTGGGTTLSLPLGEITKQVALKVFSATFADGADFRNEAVLGADYRLIVQPRVARLDYYYNQLKNLGFAITPQLEMDLSVVMLNGDGTVLLENTYVSGRSEGDTYVLSGSPQEKVNKLIHLTLFKLMTDAAVDVQKAMSGTPTG